MNQRSHQNYTKQLLLQKLTPRSSLINEGNKARQLGKLKKLGMRVPETWVLGFDVFTQYLAGSQVKPKLMAEFKSKLDQNNCYAVRSSSNIEDSLKYSFAGLFKTILDVKGFENLYSAVESIWDSVKSKDIQAYLERMEVKEKNIQMAVIIQEMVMPVYSGVLFSHNPMTGLSEIVIEAVEGPGTALVQDGITPERYVHKRGTWTAMPDEALIPFMVIESVLKTAQQIIKKLKKPLDFEWVFDGKDLYWVQMREISTIDPVHVYSNRFSKDMMPGMIHPLIWSINIPLINTVWIGLLEEMVGNLNIKAEDLAKSFYYRSYFDMGTIGKVFNKMGFPSEGLEMMMGMLPQKKGRPVFHPSMKSIRLLPRLIRFVNSKWHFEKQIKRNLPVIEVALKDFSIDDIKSADAEELLPAIQKLYNIVQKSVYLNILTPILASMYTRLLEKQLLKIGHNLDSIDLMQGMPLIDQYNPSIKLKKLNNLLNSTGLDITQALEANRLDILANKDSSNEFLAEFSAFMQRFGHLSDNSNNFTAMPWREQPELVIELIKNYKTPDKKSEQVIPFNQIGLKGFKRIISNMLYQRVKRFNQFREQVSWAYSYGYGLFRPHFLRLASLMKEKGWIDSEDQIFFLSWDEIRNAFATDNKISINKKANARMLEMKEMEDIQLPDIIYGEEAPPTFHKSQTRLEGTPTSRGYYCGKIKTVKGISEFSLVEDGDVLVIPYSDVGWTPIFAKAGAVIAESGGVLSHSSIIAREYKIPAVVSVSNALSLRDNQKVSVNGYTGEIIILDDATPEKEELTHASS